MHPSRRAFLAAISCSLLSFLSLPFVRAADPTAPARSEANLAYKEGPGLSDYEKERCFLDLYLPDTKAGFPTLVWLHGGSITAGSKDGKGAEKLAAVFTKEGIAFAPINYRLSPKALFPTYAEDTAAAFAWVQKHIAERGGDPAKVFLGGHSAGAYLSSLVGMDERLLKKYGLGQDAIAGLIPVSGQMLTHFTVRKERGLDANTIVADEAAPIYYTRKNTPPFLILFGDHDWPARWEENLYFAAAMKAAGNERVTIRQFPDRTHGSMAGKMSEPGDPVARAMIDFIQKTSAERTPSK